MSRLAVKLPSLVVALVLLSVVGTSAQVLERASFKLEDVPSSVKAGTSFTSRLVANIESGWHIYSLTKIPSGPIATTITLTKNPLFLLSGDIDSPVPVVDHDQGFGVDVEYYEGEAEFKLPIKTKSSLPAGKQKLTISVRYQACDKQMCLPPKTVDLSTEVVVTRAR